MLPWLRYDRPPRICWFGPIPDISRRIRWHLGSGRSTPPNAEFRMILSAHSFRLSDEGIRELDNLYSSQGSFPSTKQLCTHTSQRSIPVLQSENLKGKSTPPLLTRGGAILRQLMYQNHTSPMNECGPTGWTVPFAVAAASLVSVDGPPRPAPPGGDTITCHRLPVPGPEVHPPFPSSSHCSKRRGKSHKALRSGTPFPATNFLPWGLGIQWATEGDPQLRNALIIILVPPPQIDQ